MNGKVIVAKVDEFNTAIFTEIKANRNFRGRRKNDDTIYRDTICAFDIETTRIEEIEQSVMYVWQFAFLKGNDIYAVYGRTWDEFKRFFSLINEGELINLIFVHNLSYEFQFLRSAIEIKDAFVLKPRSVLKFNSYSSEFRCSYHQTHKSLDKFLKDMNVKNRKLTMDYSKKRYPWTPLTQDELDYSLNDVIGLVQAMKARLEMGNDTLYSLPLTSTGYVRRRAREAMKKFDYRKLHSMMCDYSLYTLLREEFRGGDTHANRMYAGKILTNVESWDRASSYPDVMVNCKFPMSRFKFAGNVTVDDIFRWKKFNKCFIARFHFINLRQKDVYYGCPYLSKDKALTHGKCVWDNGRLLNTLDKEEIVYSLNDVDFDIVSNEYIWDELRITDSYYAEYGYLPTPLINLVKTLYNDKTSLKGVSGREVDYALSKEMINSLYGMCAQNPVKLDILYSDTEDPFKLEEITEEGLHEKLLKYNHRAFLLYAWACWVTSWARYKLKQIVNIVGDLFVYCDTDSCKFIKDETYPIILLKIESLNKSLISDTYADDPSGHRHFIGVFEPDGSYRRFVTLGAKKYAYEDEEGYLHITISGVKKNAGARELAARGGLEALRVGFEFREAGGLESVYNDIAYGTYTIDNHSLHIGKNVVLRPSSYTVGITMEYASVIQDPRLKADFWDYYNKKHTGKA